MGGFQVMSEASIFVAALEKKDAGERAAFVAEACAGDEKLRRRVEVLLRAHGEPDDVLDRPESSAGTEDYSPITEGPGTIIGPYKLLQQIGQGGFGVVYMAEQTQPVRRTVALKIIKPGMDTAQVIARFESERQALALMDHPHIAKVLDAGATDSGRPYFVMELVKGMPITEFCDKNHMPPEVRLKLFLDVCHAIQHAHHKGVIHRDIKPSNVMVTLHDGVPVVKVIDFGVAKATAQKLTEKTIFTAYGQMIGTPTYMSPEQAEMSGLDIDTRSDVYSLGVLLYELLTGTTPLESKRLREAGYLEMQRLIREDEAPRPSTRLSSLGDAATVMAGNRGLDPRRLMQLLAGDLDWIVMKALEKDRNRRYGTPGNFAEDIERYLRREAIQARPPSTVYKLHKFVQRNRMAVAAAAVVAAALLGGTALATWQAVRARQAEQRALASLAEAEAARAAEAEERRKALESRRAADLAAEEAHRAAETALTRGRESRAVLDFLENKVLAAARPEGVDGGLGHNVTLRRAIDVALPFVAKSFADQPLTEARLRMTLGKSFASLGEARIATEQYERARALYTADLGADHADTLRCMHNLAWSYYEQGRNADALKLDEEVVALRKAKLGADHPDTLGTMHNLALVYRQLGDLARAVQLQEEILAMQRTKPGPPSRGLLASMGNLAGSYGALGRYAEARKLQEEVLTVERATLGPDHPNTLISMQNLAMTYFVLGRRAEALKLREEVLAMDKAKLGPDHPSTIMAMHDLSQSYADIGRHSEALSLLEESLRLSKTKFGPAHPYTLHVKSSLAVTYASLGKNDEALRLNEEAVRLCKTTLRQGDATTANCTYNMARIHALLIPKSPDGGKEADLAMDWLKQAVAVGFDNALVLKTDKLLAPLADRADFKKLVAEVEAGRGKNGQEMKPTGEVGPKP
jgi:serine/threonine protein kinase